jgi:hypothetical protein
VAAALGEVDEALACVARVEARIEAGDDPNSAPELLWACYEVLNTMRSSRANAVLVRAHSALMDRASVLDDVDRATFLGNVPPHRAIMTAWARVSEEAPGA